MTKEMKIGRWASMQCTRLNRLIRVFDKATLPKYSYEQARGEIQASEAEFCRGLKERRILVLDGRKKTVVRTVVDSELTSS